MLVFLQIFVNNGFNDTASLKELTFTVYDYDLNNQKIVSILNINRSKVSIEWTDDNNFKILFDNKPFFFSLKVFCTLI